MRWNQKAELAKALYALQQPDVAGDVALSEELVSWVDDPSDGVASAQPFADDLDALLERLGCPGGALRADRVHVWYCSAKDPHLRRALEVLRVQAPAGTAWNLLVNVDRAALPTPILQIASPQGSRSSKADDEDAGTWVVLEGVTRPERGAPGGAEAPSPAQLCAGHEFLKLRKIAGLDKRLQQKLKQLGQWPSNGLRDLLEQSQGGATLAEQLILLRGETQRQVGRRAELKTAQISAWLKDPRYLSESRARRLMLDLGLATDIARKDRWLLVSDATHYWTVTPGRMQALGEVLRVLGPALQQATLTVEARPTTRQYGLLEVPDQARHRTAWVVLEWIPGQDTRPGDGRAPRDLRDLLGERVAEVRTAQQSILGLLRATRRSEGAPQPSLEADPDLYVDAAQQLIELQGLAIGAVARAAGLDNNNHLYQWLGRTPDAGGLSAEQIRKVLEAIGLRGNRLASDQVHAWQWTGYVPRVDRLLQLIDPQRSAPCRILVDDSVAPLGVLLIIQHQAWNEEAWVEIQFPSGGRGDPRAAVRNWLQLLDLPSEERVSDLPDRIARHRDELQQQKPPALSDDPEEIGQDLLLFLKQIAEERSRLLGSSLQIPFNPRHDSPELRAVLKAAVAALDAGALQPLLAELQSGFTRMAQAGGDAAWVIRFERLPAGGQEPPAEAAGSDNPPQDLDMDDDIPL